MDVFLFLITIFYLPLLTTTKQPFIDCNGKSFLCENSTHFTICVDVGGGLSMSVGNIVLPCPPKTFCDEINDFECEYQASTTRNSFLRDIDTPREVTDASLTTNINDEFFYTTSSQHTEETFGFPTQGNTNVIFKDDTDNFVLLYDNSDDATLYNTPVNEIIQKNDAKSGQINEFKNKNIDVNKKFTRRHKESNQEIENAHHELSTTMEQITDTTDKMMTTFTELFSENVTTEESPSVEFVTTIKNFDDSATPSISIEYFGNNLSNITNYTLSSQNTSGNSFRNNKNVELTNDLNVNKLVNNTTNGLMQLQPIIIESSTSNALTSNSIVSDKVNNGNTSNTDEIIKGKIVMFGIEPEKRTLYTNLEQTKGFTTENVGTLERNISYQTTLKYNQLRDIEDTIVFQDLLFASTADETVTSDLSTTPETYTQNNIFLDYFIPSNSSEHLNETVATTVDENVTSDLSTTPETYIQNDKSSKAIISSESSDFDISFSDLLKVNKDFIELKTPTKIYFTDVDDSTILASTIKPENKESLKDLKSTSHNDSSNYRVQKKSSKYLTLFNFDIFNSTEGNTAMTSFANGTITDDNFQSKSESITNKAANMRNNQVVLTTIEENTTNKLFHLEAIQDFTTNNEKTLNNDTNLSNKLAPNLILSDIVSNASGASYMVINTSNTDGKNKEKTIVFGIEPENSTTQNVGTLEQNIIDQITLKNNQLRDLEDTIVFQDLLFASTAGETVTSDFSTTPETYIQNDKFLEAIGPSESSDLDISFGDLSKTNKDFIEFKAPTPVHFTEKDASTIFDFTIEPKNNESLNNLRSTSHNNYLNNDLRRISSEHVTQFHFDISNSTKGNTPITSFANKTITGDNFVNNEVNKTLNKGLLLEDTNITPNSNFFFQNTNLDLNTAIFPEEIMNRKQDAEETTSPRYNLTNNLLNITTVTFSEEGYTKPIKTIDTATYFANVDEQKIMDEVPISNVLITNVTRENYKNLNDKNIEDVEIIQTATAITDKIREDDKIIKRKNSKLLNDTFYVLDHSTQSPSEVSDFYLTTIDVNYNKSENMTNNLIENNTTIFFKSETLEDNLSTTVEPNNKREIVNNDTTVAIVENLTGSVLNISNVINYARNKQKYNSDIDHIDLKKSKAFNYQEKQITISDKNNVSEKTSFDILEYHNNFTVEELPNTTNGYARIEVTTIGYAEVITNGYTEVINKQGVPIDTIADLIKNFAQTVATISNSVNYKEQETKLFDYPTVSEDITDVPIAKSSIIDKTPEKQLKRNRKENINDSALNTENFTQRTLETQISTDTFVDLIRDDQSAAPSFSSINNKEQKTDFIEASTDNTEVHIVTSSLMIDNTQEKQLLVEEIRKDINEFVLNNTENFTQSAINKPTSFDDESKGNNFVSGKVTNNLNILYNTKNNIQTNFRSTMDIPHAIITTENIYLTSERIDTENNSNMSSNINVNINKKPVEKSKTKTYEKNISTKGNNQRIRNNTFVNSLNNSAQATSTISSSINNNEQETYLSIKNIEEKVAEEDIRVLNAFSKLDTEHVNGVKGTTHSPDEFLSSFNLLKVTNSTFNIFNETNNPTTKATIETNKDVHKNESVMTNAIYNINSVAIDNVLQENINSKSDYNLNYDKPIIRIGLQFNLQDLTTKSIDTIVKVNEYINIDNITDQHNNIKNPTLLKENKNEPLIQNCSDRSNCLFPADASMSIELRNKSIKGVSLKNNTDSSTEKIILRKNNRTILNTNISNVWSKSTVPLNPTNLQRKYIGIKDVNKNNTFFFKDGFQLQTSALGQSNVSDYVKSSTNPSTGVQLIYNLTNKNHERDKSHIKDNSRQINVTISPLITVDKNKSKENKNEIPKKILQNSNLQSLKTAPKTNILETSKSALTFDCSNRSRGRYADKDNCRKFYICIGYITPIVGLCPVNTVFSELRKLCTNNLSHCIRNNQFKCVKEGRFIDVWQENMYYLCVNSSDCRYLRFKFQCKNGYVLDKLNLICKQSKKILKLSSSSLSSNSSSSSSNKKKRNSSAKESYKKLSNDTSFKCNKVGKFVDPNNCRKYYVCTKSSKSGLRRKRKKCDSDEVFDDDKKKCVDEDSYECK